MAAYKVELEGISPYSQGQYVSEPRREKETPDEHERRTWRHRMHVDESGEVFIPPMALKNCLSDAAKFLGIQIPGKGKSTYTKHFEAGVLVVDPMPLGIKAEDVKGEERFVPASGVRGDGKRVKKVFPVIPKGWRATGVIHVLDETVTAEVLLRHLTEAGQLIGIGRFRPRNNGFFGRFRVLSLEEI